MEKELKIYLIEKDFTGSNVVVMSKPLGQYCRHNLAQAEIIEDEAQIDYSMYSLIACIYNSTPLCDIDFLKEKSKQMHKHNIAKCFVGDGFVIDTAAVLGDTITANDEQALKIVSMADIAKLFAYLKHTSCNKCLANNALVMDCATTYIEPSVIVGKGAVIYPMNWLQGSTIIGENVIVYPYNHLVDTNIGDNTKVRASFCEDAFIGKNCLVGPFSCLRAGTHIGDNCRIGDYVEIKNSTLADNVKAAHLAYIGDSFVDCGTNIGCGTVFCNFDGKQKRGVHVGKDVFIGANANLVAPITIGDGAFIAAGSTVTKDVPENSLCIARSKEVLKAEYNFRTI